ncbi:MAG TPA: DegT/DnrJ/EryC1/StrS family aminotransferase [Acidimicrobiales bacterium]|nr:DegT/DnrJ/EryC1/StrS family aminotransferase [Acidimicrobiales bacterium]
MIEVAKPWFSEAEQMAAADAIASGWVAQGPRVEAFERAVADVVGAEHGVALSSATAGLHLALAVAGVGQGDEVVVPSLSFIASANAPTYVGATPVFADVDAATQNLTPASVAAALTPRTRAVLLVHQGGTPADVAGMHAMCDPLGVTVVEDAACAIGSTYDGRPIGSHSDLVVFSFHARKILTTGEGGMVMARRSGDATRLRRLRDHGVDVNASERHRARSTSPEHYVERGFNYRMTDIQAAVGLVQLGRLDELVSRRRELAAHYRRALGDLPGITCVADPPWGRANFQSFWITLPEGCAGRRDELLRQLLVEGISARRGFMAAHLEPVHAGAAALALPVTEELTKRSLVLPLHHGLTLDDLDRVAAVVRSAWPS